MTPPSVRGDGGLSLGKIIFDDIDLARELGPVEPLSEVA